MSDTEDKARLEAQVDALRSKCLAFKRRYWDLIGRMTVLAKAAEEGLPMLNKDAYPTLAEARKAYAEYADGCMLLHWCMYPFDEWLYAADRRLEMESEINRMKGNTNGKEGH